MLAKLTLFDGTVYRFSDRTVDTADGLYRGRIKEDIELSSRISENGSAPASINLTIINDDKTIPYNKDLWGAELLLTSDSGVKWTGKVVFSNFDADGNLYISASEKAAPELEYYMPDEVRQVYTVDENFHQSSVSMTIPMVIGGTHDKPVTLGSILIDKQNGIYLICVGEIREIVNVYNGAELLPSSAYTAYTGTSSQTDHKGFAYVQISEDYRKNSDGSYAEINVDVVGLKLANHTEAECRNPARFLYYFLTTAATGINGWGCGISASDIDTASFNSAMTLCDSLNYKLDGIMWMRQQAQSWINQICQTMHASYSINADGKRSLFIDYAGAASKKTFNLSNMKLSRYGKNAYTNTVYNKGVLTYGYNPITGLFMQSAQYDNQQSIDQIGEQKFVGESYLINDPATALSVLEYTCKKSQIQAEAIEFETDDLSTYLRAGDLITIDHDDISGLFQISNINTDSVKSTIVANRFDPSIFVVGGSASRVDWQNERDITPAMSPAQATNLLLSTGFDINQDGTGNPYISGTFTVPEGGWLAAAVQYGIGANPTNYTELALITEGRFKIQPVNVGTVYTIRVRMITATGHSDYITGQITSTGDTVAPDIPTIVLNSTDKTVIVKCAIDNPPSDMGGFQIWRKKRSEEVFTLIGNVAANFGYASFPDHVENYVQYDYKAKSYDRSGNLSDFSQVVSITPTGLEATELAATAIKIPTGSILNINAKGSTTESIKTANGVIDGSGYGHHGKADNTVAISNDVDFGPCFDFAGAGGITMPNLDISEGMTYVFKVKNLGVNTGTGYSQIFRHYKTSNGIIVRIRPANDYADIQIYNNSSSALTSNVAIPSDTNIFTFAFAVDSSGSAIYINGEKKAESTSVKLLAAITNVPLTINKTTTKPGLFNDFRIYKRRLSDTEIKSISMIPQESMFHAVTADLIGANAVKAIHLDAESVTANAVGTNQIITNTANIADAVITDAKISGTLGANRIEANSITSDKINVVGIPAGLIFRLGFSGLQSYADGTIIPDLSSHNVGFKIGGTWSGNYTSSSVGHALDGRNTSTHYIANSVPVTVGASGWTFFFKFYASLTYGETTYQYIAIIRPSASDSSKRLLVRIRKSDGVIQILSRGSTDTTDQTITTSLIVASSTWYNLIVRCTSTTNIYVYLVPVGQANVVDSEHRYQCTLTSARVGVVCAADTGLIFGGNGSTSVLYGLIGDIMFFNRALNENEIKFLVKSAINLSQDSGTITSDRIATDALKSRNYVENANTDAGLAFTTNGSFFNLAKGTLATPFFRVGCDSSNVYDCQIGCFKVSSDNSLVGDGLSSRDFAAISVSAPYQSGSFTNKMTASSITISGTYTIRPTTFNNSVVLSTEGLYFFDVVNPTTQKPLHGINVSWYESRLVTYGLYTSGAAYCASGAWSGSDRNTKSQIKQESVINRLKQIELTSWKYDQDKIDGKKTNKGTKNQPKHYGPMAQEFNNVFGTSDGASDSICYTDTIGVALRAIQELAAQVDDLKRQVRSYKRILNITDEQIAEERDKTAIRKLEIAKARQAKRVTLEITAIKEHESPMELEEVEDVEINTADSDDDNA